MGRASPDTRFFFIFVDLLKNNLVTLLITSYVS